MTFEFSIIETWWSPRTTMAKNKVPQEKMLHPCGEGIKHTLHCHTSTQFKNSWQVSRSKKTEIVASTSRKETESTRSSKSSCARSTRIAIGNRVSRTITASKLHLPEGIWAMWRLEKQALFNVVPHVAFWSVGQPQLPPLIKSQHRRWQRANAWLKWCKTVAWRSSIRNDFFSWSSLQKPVAPAKPTISIAWASIGPKPPPRTKSAFGINCLFLLKFFARVYSVCAKPHKFNRLILCRPKTAGKNQVSIP